MKNLQKEIISAINLVMSQFNIRLSLTRRKKELIKSNKEDIKLQNKDDTKLQNKDDTKLQNRDKVIKTNKTQYIVYTIMPHEETAFDKIQKVDILYKSGLKETFYKFRGFDYKPEEIIENTKYEGGRLDNIEKLGKVGGNVIFVSDAPEGVKPSICFGNVVLGDKLMEELRYLTNSKKDEHISEVAFKENELKYITPDTANLWLYVIVFAIVVVILFSQWMGGQGQFWSIIDRACHPLMNLTNTTLVNNTTAIYIGG